MHAGGMGGRERARGVPKWAAVLWALPLLGCGEPPPPAPSAVIRACPAAVCLGDDFATSIHLDASKSAPRLTLVEVPADPDEPPLSFSWSFSGSGMLFDRGTTAEPDILVSMKADRPLHVRLRVENADGGVAEALQSIAVTPLDEAGLCPLPDPEDDTSDDCLSIGAGQP